MVARGPLLGLLGGLVLGCSMPTLTSDGKLVWTPGAERGASVLTANGIEFVDRAEPPRPVVRKSPYEPYRAATGLLVPADGTWHRLAQAVSFQADPLSVTVRSGDVLVPAWGGELLLEVELAAAEPGGAVTKRKTPPERAPLGALAVSPPSQQEARAPMRLLLVVDDVSESTAGLVCGALSGLRGGDQVAIVDTRGVKVVIPFVGYEHRSLIEGALRRRVAMHPPGSGGRDLPGSLALARDWFAREPDPKAAPQVLVVTDGATLEQDSGAVPGLVDALVAGGVQVAAAGLSELVDRGQMKVFRGSGEGGRRPVALDRVLPAAPSPSLRDVTLSVASSPAPAHVIEATAGQVGLSLDEDLLFVGGLGAGEARTELLRVSVPPFVPGEEFALSLRVEGRDAVSGEAVVASRRFVMRYSNDVEALARERSGDVVAYASALAMVKRLDRGMFGEGAEQPGGLRKLVDWERAALGRLAHDSGDPLPERRARLLQALAWSLE